MKIFVTVLLMSLAFLSNGQSDQRFIEVIGTGEINVEPDLAVLAIELREFNRNGNVVSVDNLEAELRKTLTSLNIPADQLIANASSSRQPAINRPVGRERQFSLQLTDIKTLEPLLGRLREAGIQTSLTESAHSDIGKFINEARVKAIQSAREKAELLASAANVKLGRVLQIREIEADATHSQRRSVPVPGGDRRGRPGSSDLEPISLTYNVIVRFMIE